MLSVVTDPGLMTFFCCNFAQGIGGSSHRLEHTLDVLIWPCDSDFVWNDIVDKFISDHAVKKMSSGCVPPCSQH